MIRAATLLIVPRHEPETIAAAARRSGVSAEKTPTTSLRFLMRGRAKLTSRYRKGDDLELMAMALDAILDHAAIAVLAVDCDSACRSSF